MSRKRKENGEQKAPGIGHNQLSDDQLAALTFDHKRKIVAFRAAKKKAGDELKVAEKLAKAELGDDAVHNIDTMIAMETAEGEAAIKKEIERQATVARWMGMPFGSQSEMFVDRTPAVDQARAQGKKVGLAGEPCKPPHDPSTPQHTSWLEGFHEGQAVLAKGIRPLPLDTKLAEASAAQAHATARADEEKLATAH